MFYTDRNKDVLSNPEYAKQVTDAIPMHDYAMPEDAAGAAVLLASDAGRYIAGSTIMIDGGQCLCHVSVMPDGSCYAVVDLGLDRISVYRMRGGYDLEFVSAFSTLPDKWKGESAVAAIRVSGDGAKVFVSNRGHDSIAAFSFSEDFDRLELLSISSLPGKLPRDFNFLPSGCLALVTLEGSGRVVSLSCEAETGRMSAVDSLDGFFRPSSVTVPVK